MSDQAIKISRQMDAVMEGRRKFLTNAVARAIATQWQHRTLRELSRLAECGGITDVGLLRAEIEYIVDSISVDAESSDYAVNQLMALDGYVARFKHPRRPVSGWDKLSVA